MSDPLFNAASYINNSSGKKSENGTTLPPIGKNSNCAIKSVIFDPAAKAVSITFTTKDNKHIYKTLFAPSGEYPLNQETPEEALKRKTVQNIKYLMSLIAPFVSSEELSKVSANSYEEFVTMLVQLINAISIPKGFVFTVNVEHILRKNGKTYAQAKGNVTLSDV